jgi:hypothetical protein
MSADSGMMDALESEGPYNSHVPSRHESHLPDYMAP